MENKKGRYRKVQIKRINSWAAAVIAEGEELEGLLHQVSRLRWQESTLLFWRFRSTGIPHQEGESLTELQLHIPCLLHGGDITQGSYQPTHTINVKYSFLKNFKSRRRPSVWTFKRPPLYLETFWHIINSLGKYRTHFELVPIFFLKKEHIQIRFFYLHCIRERRWQPRRLSVSSKGKTSFSRAAKHPLLLEQDTKKRGKSDHKKRKDGLHVSSPDRFDIYILSETRLPAQAQRGGPGTLSPP